MLPGTQFSFSLPTRVLFGDGQRTVLAQHIPQGEGVVVFVRGQSGAASGQVAQELRDRGYTLSEVVCPSEPTVASVNAAVQALAGQNVVAVVACGGGSVLDTGKAVAVCLSAGLTLAPDLSNVPAAALEGPRNLRLIALPTTAGTGAEVTANAVLALPDAQTKLSLRGAALYPDVALVDPQLMQGAPASVVLNAGLDAVVQAIEAYCSCHATPFTDGLMAPNIERGLKALRAAVELQDPEAARELAWVSLSSGVALANGGLGAAHGLAAVLGGRYAAPHGALCGRLLAAVLRRNLAKAVPGSAHHLKIDHCIETIGQVFPPHDAADDLSGFEAWLAVQTLPRLRAFGVDPTAFETLSAQAVTASSSQKNPVALSQRDFTTILQEAV